MLQQAYKITCQHLSWPLSALAALAVLTLLLAPDARAESAISEARLLELDQASAEASTTVTTQLASLAGASYSDIDKLVLAVTRLASSGDQRSAVVTIKANLALVKEHIDDKAVLSFISTLLAFNDKATADELYQQVESEGDKSLVSNVAYIFAKYYFSRNQWDKVTSLLGRIFIDLPSHHAAHAYLMYGTALQQLKQHRKAVKFYEKINRDTEYYAYGQLNTALAYIRQDWWSDAHLIIKAVLEDDSIIKSDELVNRLYLVLGYSLLQKDYYRDSRAAFRNISQDSQYVNRALLGISLTAASQTDYIGSLNLLSILKNKPSKDLSVDESYLIIPYVYNNLKQQLTASASYNEALAYYQNRIEEIERLITNNESFSLSNMTKTSGVFIIDNNIFDLNEKYPEAFFSNLKIIDSLVSVNSASSSNNGVIALHQDFQKTLNEMIQEALAERKVQLISYLNQARYGLAKMYDSNQSPDQ